MKPVLIDPSTGMQRRFTLRRPEHTEDVVVRAPNGAIVETDYPSSTSGPTYLWSTQLSSGKRTRTGPLDGYVVSFAFPRRDTSRMVGTYRVDRREGSQVLPSESGLAVYDLTTVTRTVLVSYRAVEVPSIFGPGAPPQPALVDTIGPTASWSPDTGRVIYVHRHDARMAAAADVPYEELVSVRADGSDAVVLTHGGQVRHPTWSPDGSTIAFESTRPDDGLDPTCRPASISWRPTAPAVERPSPGQPFGPPGRRRVATSRSRPCAVVTRRARACSTRGPIVCARCAFGWTRTIPASRGRLPPTGWSCADTAACPCSRHPATASGGSGSGHASPRGRRDPYSEPATPGFHAKRWATIWTSDRQERFVSTVLLDGAGGRRSSVIMPGFHLGSLRALDTDRQSARGRRRSKIVKSGNAPGLRCDRSANREAPKPGCAGNDKLSTWRRCVTRPGWRPRSPTPKPLRSTAMSTSRGRRSAPRASARPRPAGRHSSSRPPRRRVGALSAYRLDDRSTVATTATVAAATPSA